MPTWPAFTLFMSTDPSRRRTAWFALALLLAGGAAQAETVLFPFDDYSLPFNKGLRLELVPGSKDRADRGPDAASRGPRGPVMPPGKPGDPDYPRLYYVGTVIHIGDEYRMWYTSWDEKAKRQVCYAVSKDGIHWDRPKLGLTEYKGGTANNLVEIDGKGPIIAATSWVLYEPEDPNPDRRFKMMWEPDPSHISAGYSPDGLHWKSSPGNPIIRETSTEPSGLIKFDGIYYLNGHGGPIPHPVAGTKKRMMVTYASYDFDHWTTAGHISFRRDNTPPRPPGDFEGHRGEQVHLGASLWNRGNVVIGFYGQYHNDTNDRRTSRADIGLIVSHDAIHFSEPVPDFKIIPSAEEPDNAEARLIQGQGFENIGDRTFVWYGIWVADNPNGPTGVRLATWARDRLGYFAPPPRMKDAHCLSCPLAPGRDGRIFINADGLSAAGRLKVEILDDRFVPVPGYSGADAVPLVASGLRMPVSWRQGGTLPARSRPIRVRVSWEGADADLARLYAVYVD